MASLDGHMSSAAGPLSWSPRSSASPGWPRSGGPCPPATALRSAGLPGSLALARVLGGVEVVVGRPGPRLGGPSDRPGRRRRLPRLRVRRLVRLIARPGPAGCGCFGDDSAPVTNLHVGAEPGAAAALAGVGRAVADPRAAGHRRRRAHCRSVARSVASSRSASCSRRRRSPRCPSCPAASREAERGVTGAPARGRDRRARAAGAARRRAAAQPRRDPPPPPRARRRPGRGRATPRRHPRTSSTSSPRCPRPADARRSRPGATSAASASTTTPSRCGSSGVEHRTLVAFLSGSCLTCQRFWDAFRKPAELGLAPRRPARRRHQGPRPRRARRASPGWRPPASPS